MNRKLNNKKLRKSVSLFQLSGIAILMLILCLVGCKQSDKGGGKPVLAVSYDAQKYLLEQIAGPDYDIKVLLPSGSDPEMYEPDMRVMTGIEGADAYFTTSTLGFEERMGDILESNYPGLSILDVSVGIEQIEGTHSGEVKGALSLSQDHGKHTHAADPHLLTSIGNVQLITENMLKGLKATYPDKAEAFEARYEEFSQRLYAQSERMDSIMSPLQGQSFVVMHPAMSYFARDYGLTQVALEKDGKEASPRQLKERLDEAAAAQPIILFYEKGHGESGAKSMAATLGVAAYPINFEGSDFLQQLEQAAAACRDAINSIGAKM